MTDSPKEYVRKIYNLSDIYREYVLNGGTLSKNDFKNICQDFNIHICNHLIYDSGIFYIPHNLSTLEVIRINRNPSKKRVDWPASNEYRKELEEANQPLFDKESGKGKKWLIYQSGDEYCRFYWKKRGAKVKNKSVYRLEMTRGDKGNKTKLKSHLYENDTYYLKYRKAR